VASVDKRGQLVLLHDARWDILDWNPHVFIPLHRSIQVKIFNVNGHEAGAGSGDSAVDDHFDGEEATVICEGLRADWSVCGTYP